MRQSVRAVFQPRGHASRPAAAPAFAGRRLTRACGAAGVAHAASLFDLLVRRELQKQSLTGRIPTTIGLATHLIKL